jgi:hypothetical protein
MTDRSGVGREGIAPAMLGTVEFLLPFSCQTAKVRGVAFSVSPKSLTVNTITPRIGGHPGAARP